MIVAGNSCQIPFDNPIAKNKSSLGCFFIPYNML